MAGIVSEPLNPRTGFNWVFLVELLICGILVVFFLFYFNRLFATLVSYAVRAYTWQKYRAYIDIQALQISLLGGRIFFKDIRYHGHNETILIHGGHITWQYWLRRVRDAQVFSSDRADRPGDASGTPSTTGSRASASSKNDGHVEEGGRQTQKRLPCRISIKISGVEAFIYNRTPAYDGIVDAMSRKARPEAGDMDGTAEKASVAASNASLDHDSPPHKLRKAPTTDEPELDRAGTQRSVTAKTKPDPPPSFLRILPVHVECNKGAVVLGNEHTQSVITAQFEKASGDFDASQSGPLDSYQQTFNFQFHHPVVHMKPNPDFKASQLDTAARLKHEVDHEESDGNVQAKQHKARRKPRTWHHHLPYLSRLFATSSDSIQTHSAPTGGNRRRSQAPQLHLPNHERWKGLSRYIDDSQTAGHAEWDDVEYAKTSLIVDCPCINVSFYWDIAGPVPGQLENSLHMDSAFVDDINGSTPPEYGMDIQVFGGTINYGPWADRHRAILQNIFFPGNHVDGVPATRLVAGDSRVLSIFKIFINIERDTVLRIPVREPSKDWKWKGKAETLAGHGKSSKDKSDKAKAKPRRKSLRSKHRENASSGANVRPFAWIDVKVAGNSTVNYVMDMVASENGFMNTLTVDIPSTEISSSVNHGLLWRSGALGLQCDLSNPLGWNKLRTWLFKITCRDLELFLLRDHLFLLTDLVADWGSGPGADYYNFVPFRYLLNIDFQDFRLYINTNDSNIVNNPSDLDDNSFIVLHGQRLHGDVTIPLDNFKPLQNEISFDVRGQDMGLEISMPQKLTLNTFVQSNHVATLGGLALSGSHTYLTETSSANTDRLFMDIQGSRLCLELYGWLIHHFLKLKENYFGENLHFKTLEEFQGQPSQSLATDATAPNGQPAKLSNDLDVILCIGVEDASVLLPCNLYSAKNSLRAELPFASADLRFTNYYMDLMVNFSPISVSLGTAISSPSLPNDSSGQTEVFVQSVAIYGHRLFGLPPIEPTYVCNWDFEVGTITGECSSQFLERATGAARSFGFTFDDEENSLAPAENPIIIPDATFLRLRMQHIHLWLHVAQEALLLSTNSISLDFNDLAGNTFSQRLNILVPDIIVGAVDARSVSRYRTRGGVKEIVDTHAFLQTSLALQMLKRKSKFTEERDKQQAHLRGQDQRTQRTHFLFREDESSASRYASEPPTDLQSPALQYPYIAAPVFLVADNDASQKSTGASVYGSKSMFEKDHMSRRGSNVTSSTASMSRSIRSTERRKHATEISTTNQDRALLARSVSKTCSERDYALTSHYEYRQNNLPPLSVALSSSLAPPYFPLDRIEPDSSDAPPFPSTHFTADKAGEDAVTFNMASTHYFDETSDHTSFLVQCKPGIRVHCTPEVVRCITDIIELAQPSQPEDILDGFQVDVLTEILTRQVRRKGKGASTDLSLEIPFIHVRFHNSFEPKQHASAGKDQYDIILNRLKVLARLKKLSGNKGDSVSLHTKLGSLGMSVTERNAEGPANDVAVQAELKDVLLWIIREKEASINLRFRSFEAATASRKIQYLATLIERTTVLSNDLEAQFRQVGTAHLLRLRYLAWFLTMRHEQYPDPAFLTKVSYALRAPNDHLRSQDSWKIISRFRYIWQSLPMDQKSEIQKKCRARTIKYPDNIEDIITNTWDTWRTWDVSHVKDSLAMKTLFNVQQGEESSASGTPLHVDIRSQLISLILDPGPKQSEISAFVLAINAAILPPLEPTGLMLLNATPPKTSTIVQINVQQISIDLQWEICELGEELLKLFESGDGSPREAAPRPRNNNDRDAENILQVILVADDAKIVLETINLRAMSSGRRFRCSFVESDSTTTGRGKTSAVLLHLEEAIMECSTKAHSQRLVRSQFHLPSLYVSQYCRASGEGAPKKIKVAAASRTIRLAMEENIPGLLEVVDTVLRDEVTYINRQAQILKKSFLRKPKSKPEGEKAVSPQLPHVNLALFMDEYFVELALLQSLAWSIRGSSGRLSVVPALGDNVTLRIDYDLAAHTHRMHSSATTGSNVISSLELPPVNGRLTVTNTASEMRVSATGIIETITLQAAEIQALIATINKPEITNVGRTIKDDVQALRAHVEEIFPSKSPPVVMKPPTSARTIAFDVRMTLSGLSILASAPPLSPDAPAANLAIKIASVQLTTTNIGPKNARLVLPEAMAHLQRLDVELDLRRSGSIQRCGNVSLGATFRATAEQNAGADRRVYKLFSSGLEVNIFAETASAVVDVMNHLQDRIKELDLSKEKRYLRRLRHTKSKMSQKRKQIDQHIDTASTGSGTLFTSNYLLELLDIQISWIVGTSVTAYSKVEKEDLVLLFKRIDFSTKADDTALLLVEDTQLQMVPISRQKKHRSLNSALLPRMVFNVGYASTKETRKVAFHAAGKALDLRLDSRFILPANVIEQSIALASKKLRTASSNWNMTPTTSGAARSKPFGNKRLESLLVDANFAGAVVTINGSEAIKSSTMKEHRSQHKGRYSQFVGDGSQSSMALRAPAIALKVEFQDDGHDPSINAELRIDGSNNTLYPTVVPLLIDISDSIKEVVREKDEKPPDPHPDPPAESQPKPAAKLLEDDTIISADPSALLGRTRLNFGLRICKQEFSLSCQPIARVAAIAKLEDIYVTVNSVKSQDHGHFFAANAVFEKLETTVQHVYSRESTFGFNVDSIVLSLMNSKHLSGTSGISAILKINPMALQVNARQLQDFLLFREIWLPPEIRRSTKGPPVNVNQEPQEYLMQRYQQVTAATAFPWNANVSIADVSVDLDLGQAIGKTSLHIHNLWASSKKGTDWEQNLCVGVKSIGVHSSGRTSGFVQLSGVKVRTSISWPIGDSNARQTPLVQASIGFEQLRVKAGFDYQAFVIADIANFNFLMYNVREKAVGAPDRLVAILDGDKVHVFCTATSAAQGLALYQALERLIQENQQAYAQSLRDIEKFLRRKSSASAPIGRSASSSMINTKPDHDSTRAPISLHTDVVVTLRSMEFGVYPSTFVDSQILMLESSDVQARFAVAPEQTQSANTKEQDHKIHSALGMTLGKLSVALSSISHPKREKQASDLTVDDVIESAHSARGGTILRVPKVVANMRTWQVPKSVNIDYVFKSMLEGKVDVGWNYSRISYIRTMWTQHSRTLAQRLGKPLPEGNIKITSSTQHPASSASSSLWSSSTTPQSLNPLSPTKSNPTTEQEKESAVPPSASKNQEKITAEVKVPESKYSYTALEPPLIETPQLRDMGEATPPLEWIGLHRDRLPNVTHQIVIVSLLEVAREVEDAYERILGSS